MIILTINLLSVNNSLPINRLLYTVEKISNCSDNNNKVKRVIARYIRSVLEGKQQSAMLPSTVDLLNFSERLLYLAAAPKVAELIKAGRLVGVSPYWNKGRLVTKGRLGDGVKKVLGVAELQVLHKDSRLAYLIMVRAHKQSHKWAKETLYQS